MSLLGSLFGSSGNGPPKCSSCGARLSGGESILGGGAIIVSSRPAGNVQDDYSLYHGSICFTCRKVFCTSCLGSRVDRCPSCRGETKPAYKRHLREL